MNSEDIAHLLIENSRVIKDLRNELKKASEKEVELINSLLKARAEQEEQHKLEVLHLYTLTRSDLSKILGITVQAVHQWGQSFTDYHEWYWYIKQEKPQYFDEFQAHINSKCKAISGLVKRVDYKLEVA